MAENKTCINRRMALEILETVIEPMTKGVQREALECVFDWLENKFDPGEAIGMTREERDARIIELLTKARNRMSIEERRENARFYLDTIITKKAFDAMSETEQTDFLRDGGLVEEPRTNKQEEKQPC